VVLSFLKGILTGCGSLPYFVPDVASQAEKSIPMMVRVFPE